MSDEISKKYENVISVLQYLRKHHRETEEDLTQKKKELRDTISHYRSKIYAKFDERRDFENICDKNSPRKIKESLDRFKMGEYYDFISKGVENTNLMISKVKQSGCKIFEIAHQSAKNSFNRRIHDLQTALSYTSDSSENGEEKGAASPEHKYAKEEFEDIMQAVKIYMRKISDLFPLDDVVESILKNEEIQDLEGKNEPYFKTFVTECARLCWQMVVQTPPILIDVSCTPYSENCNTDVSAQLNAGTSEQTYPSQLVYLWPTIYQQIGDTSRRIMEGDILLPPTWKLDAISAYPADSLEFPQEILIKFDELYVKYRGFFKAFDRTHVFEEVYRLSWTSVRGGDFDDWKKKFPVLPPESPRSEDRTNASPKRYPFSPKPDKDIKTKSREILKTMKSKSSTKHHAEKGGEDILKEIINLCFEMVNRYPPFLIDTKTMKYNDTLHCSDKGYTEGEHFSKFERPTVYGYSTQQKWILLRKGKVV